MGIQQDSLQSYFLLGLVAFFAIMSFQLMRPYLLYIVSAIMLVYVAYPGYIRIRRIVGNETLAAILSMAVLLLIAVVPTIFVTDTIVRESKNVLANVGTQTASLIDTSGIEAEIAAFIGEPVNLDTLIADAFRSAGTFFSERLPGLITTVLDAIIGVFIMAATMFYIFKDGDDLTTHITHMLPLQEQYAERLLEETDNIAEAIVVGHLLTATVQGLLVGLGLVLVGIPNVMFWTFIMIVLGIIPLVGNFLVWGPAGAYLILITQQPVLGGFLLVYGTVMTTASDYLIRSTFVGRRSGVHPLLVMIGVIGGLPMFGLLGIMLGPLTLGVFVSVLRVYRTEFLS